MYEIFFFLLYKNKRAIITFIKLFVLRVRGQFGPWVIRPWSIRTLKNSGLVNSDLDHWSILTPTTGQFGPFFIGRYGPQKEKNLWSIRTFSLVRFGPFPLVNSDLFHWSTRTFSFGQFGPFPLVISDLCIMYFPKRKLRSG